MTSGLLAPVGAAVGACVVVAVGFALGQRWERIESRFWRKRADYWFERAMLAEVPHAAAAGQSAVSLVKEGPATYCTLDALAGSRRGEP